MPTAAPNAVVDGTTASEPDATGALCLPCRVERHPELTALARALKIPAQAVSPWGPDLERLARVLSQPALDGAQIEFRLQRFTRSAPLMRTLAELYRALARQLDGAAGKNPVMRVWLEEKLRALGPWYAAAAGVRLRSRLTAQAEIPPVVLDLVSRCLYGSPLARENEEETLYLADAWPGIDLAFLEALPAILERHRTAKARRERVTAATRRGVRLGSHAEDATPVILDDTARAQHLYMIGGTGTGKSTLMANMIAQDMQAGEAIVVIDPHGSLVEDVLRLVPKRRRKDVLYLHPTDPEGAFTLNLLEPIGSDLAVERNRCANDLIALMKIVYPEPAEAFGPMFQNYFRNAVFLVLAGREDKAVLSEVRRLFADASFRAELTRCCPDAGVKMFWDRIAARIAHSGENASIDNVAPYVDAKLTQLSGNPVIERIIGMPKSSVNFGRIATDRRICLINLAQRLIGDEDARFLGGLLFGRLSAYLKLHAAAHVGAPAKAPLPLRVYLDEFQSYADEGLSMSMAQMRKFGLSYVLANQNFGQIAGRGWRPNVGQEVLGNASTIVAFRISHIDAELLAPWFHPAIGKEDLIQLPNYRAAVRLLPDGTTSDPYVFKTDAPRKTVRARTARSRRRKDAPGATGAPSQTH